MYIRRLLMYIRSLLMWTQGRRGTRGSCNEPYEPSCVGQSPGPAGRGGGGLAKSRPGIRGSGFSSPPGMTTRVEQTPLPPDGILFRFWSSPTAFTSYPPRSAISYPVGDRGIPILRGATRRRNSSPVPVCCLSASAQDVVDRGEVEQQLGKTPVGDDDEEARAHPRPRPFFLENIEC